MSSTVHTDLVRQLVTALRTQSWNGAEELERSWGSSVVRAGGPEANETRQPPLSTARAAAVPPTPRAEPPRPVDAPLPPAPTPGLDSSLGPDLPPESALTALQATARACQRCPRASTRRQVVFGAGNPRARLVIIGAAPDAASDAAGTPFAGPAGELLDKMLQAMHLHRAEVWLTTLVLCRGADDGPPESEAVAACEGFLARQIDHVRPEALLLFGEPAARAVLHSRGAFADLRGQWRTAFDVPTIATHAPADMLRDPALKRFAWADLQQIMTRLRLTRA